MFKFVEKGSIVSLGKEQAVGEVLNELNIYGKLARTAYDALYRLHPGKYSRLEPNCAGARLLATRIY